MTGSTTTVVLVQYPVNLVTDRHLDAELVGDFLDRFSGEHAFDDLLNFFLSFFDRHATCQRQAHAAITRQIVSAGKDEIAHARQSHECFSLCADRYAQAHEFHEPAGNQRDAGVCAEAEAVRHAGSDREHVLYGTADFHADHVV